MHLHAYETLTSINKYSVLNHDLSIKLDNSGTVKILNRNFYS